MPESQQNTRGQCGAPDPVLDDYLPDFSPRPKYVIATIFPPSRDVQVVPGTGSMTRCSSALQKPLSRTPDLVLEDLIQGTGWRDSALGIPSSLASGSGSEAASRLQNQPVTICPTTILPAGDLVREPAARDAVPHMDLPRGTFRSLERHASVISLLHRLHISRFRGSCRISRDGMPILLVFDQGRIILAEYDDLAGDLALGMICTHRFARVDALISDLNDAQIRLSLEFNPSWKVQMNQEPTWMVSPEVMPELCRKVPEEPESTPHHTPSNTETQLSSPEPLSPYTDVQGSDAGTSDRPAAAALPENPPSLDTDAPPDPGDGNLPDWKKALGVPLSSSGEAGEPEAPRHSRPAPVRDGDVDWKAALTLPFAVQSEIGGASSSHEGEEDRDTGEEWIKALSMPVRPSVPEPGIPSFEQGAEQGRAMNPGPKFERLSGDSILFDDTPARRRMPVSAGPEPAEQWKSMGINHGENSSV